ncbi:transposase [Myxococcus sp. RHSTA-1-4]|uniref:transposase n=1 Tax=Myxococcus sp. RHSTA-1-4 TaxID=2874601 RepID=UPI001CC0E6DF|nr:transposase [Myxococcus sp. RHSTA-1-4]
MPEGVFVPGEGGVRFEALPPPTQGEVERLLRVVRHRVLRLLEKRGALPAQGPEDALQAYPAHSLQQRLRWTEVDVRPPPNKQPRCALLEGFSLHANTHLHANDRQGLERRCRYGARGALALERLSRAEDGRIAYRMKRPLPDGTTHLLLAYVKGAPGVRANLKHLGMPTACARLSAARGPPGRRVLRHKRRQQAGGRCHASDGSEAWAGVSPKGAQAVSINVGDA